MSYRESFSSALHLGTSGQQITWGAWSALDVATGNILWQTADPTVGSIDTGSVSVATASCMRAIFRTDVRARHKNRTDPLELADGGTVTTGLLS